MPGEEIHGSLYFQLKLDGPRGLRPVHGGHRRRLRERGHRAEGVDAQRQGVAIKKIPGNLKFNDITLKRGVDADNGLWQWRQQVVDGKVKEARCDGTDPDPGLRVQAPWRPTRSSAAG